MKIYFMKFHRVYKLECICKKIERFSFCHNNYLPKIKASSFEIFRSKRQSILGIISDRTSYILEKLWKTFLGFSFICNCLEVSYVIFTQVRGSSWWFTGPVRFPCWSFLRIRPGLVYVHTL